MLKNGTASFDLGQYNEVLVAVIRALPGALDGADPARLLGALQNRGTILERHLGIALHAMLEEQESVVIKIPHYADGAEFEMTLNGDAPENQPLEMVRRDGYSGRWKHSGPTVKGTQTQCFKWVAVGYQPNFDAVRTALAPYGKIPEGQWREAVKHMFESDGEHPRGIADSSWVDPFGNADFPYVSTYGNSYFRWAGGDFRVAWRWLVEVSK